MLHAVDISAAHKADKVSPAITGGNDNIIIGSAKVASTPGIKAFDEIPSIAHKKPIGIIIKAPNLNPFTADLSSFDVRPIWITPWIEFVLPHITTIQAIIAGIPIPSVKLKYGTSVEVLAICIAASQPPWLKNTIIEATIIPK